MAPTSDAVTTVDDVSRQKRIQGVASPALHGILLLSERLSRLSRLWLVLYIDLLALLVVLIWSAVIGAFEVGIAVGMGFLLFAVVDWIALAALPQRNRSYGPVGPGLIAFTSIRAVLTIGAAIIPVSSLWTGTLLEIGNLALTGYVLESLWGEPFRLGVTTITLRSPKLRGAPPLRVLHFSDLHVERLTRREQKLLQLIRELRPDIIVYTGDLLNFSNLDDERARADCRELLSKITAPLGVYAIPGTPLIDTPEVLAEIYAGLDNITLLTDQTSVVEGYPQVELVGLACTHDPMLDAPRLERLIAEISPTKFSLLLYHSPDLMPEASQAGIDLYLCGHTHGGQVRLPLIGALVTSSIYGKRYEMGCYVQNGTTMYVSRGVGMEGKGAPRMRFLCPPEIELFVLRGSDK